MNINILIRIFNNYILLKRAKDRKSVEEVTWKVVELINKVLVRFYSQRMKLGTIRRPIPLTEWLIIPAPPFKEGAFWAPFSLCFVSFPQRWSHFRIFFEKVSVLLGHDSIDLKGKDSPIQFLWCIKNNGRLFPIIFHYFLLFN